MSDQSGQIAAVQQRPVYPAGFRQHFLEDKARQVQDCAQHARIVEETHALERRNNQEKFVDQMADIARRDANKRSAQMHEVTTNGAVFTPPAMKMPSPPGSQYPVNGEMPQNGMKCEPPSPALKSPSRRKRAAPMEQQQPPAQMAPNPQLYQQFIQQHGIAPHVLANGQLVHPAALNQMAQRYPGTPPAGAIPPAAKLPAMNPNAMMNMTPQQQQWAAQQQQQQQAAFYAQQKPYSPSAGGPMPPNAHYMDQRQAAMIQQQRFAMMQQQHAASMAAAQQQAVASRWGQMPNNPQSPQMFRPPPAQCTSMPSTSQYYQMSGPQMQANMTQANMAHQQQLQQQQHNQQAPSNQSYPHPHHSPAMHPMYNSPPPVQNFIPPQQQQPPPQQPSQQQPQPGQPPQQFFPPNGSPYGMQPAQYPNVGYSGQVTPQLNGIQQQPSVKEEQFNNRVTPEQIAGGPHSHHSMGTPAQFNGPAAGFVESSPMNTDSSSYNAASNSGSLENNGLNDSLGNDIFNINDESLLKTENISIDAYLSSFVFPKDFGPAIV